MLTRAVVDEVVTRALAEDAPWGDLTCEALVPADAWADAALVAREPGTLAGVDVFARAMELVGGGVEVTLLLRDGDRFEAGDVIARVAGPARSVLGAERVALNLVQRLTGVATLTAAHVAAVAGTRARIADTRKTTPGLRALERHAVRCGGGSNHRFSLSDAVMAKDNHLAVLQASGVGLTEALRTARTRIPHTAHLEVEVDRLDQVEAVLAADVDTIMLDNFSLEDLATGVAQVAGRALVEASGGIDLGTVAAVAATGVDVISVGALTHAARALDLGLDVTTGA
ncbi:MAG: carboxylating nicotinate-nucleotide diphosphorylase [Nocardioidaceae bacterium]|nr:carboxylating nicotinate-nucleotide diphosphorylase [Nocardioidaceae bacterium]